MIPSLSVALADAIQAPLAQKLSYASVAKSDEHEAISGRGRAKETIFSACGRDVRRPAVCGRDDGVLQADSKLPQAHINNGVHINSKDKAGMQRNRAQHIFNHLCDRSRFSIP